MFGVTFKNEEEIRELGYRILENSTEDFATHTKIVAEKNDEVVAEMWVNKDENASLKISVGEECLENIKWILIKAVFCPTIIIIQAMDFEGEEHWCQLPLTKGPVFY